MTKYYSYPPPNTSAITNKCCYDFHGRTHSNEIFRVHKITIALILCLSSIIGNAANSQWGNYPDGTKIEDHPLQNKFINGKYSAGHEWGGTPEKDPHEVYILDRDLEDREIDKIISIVNPYNSHPYLRASGNLSEDIATYNFTVESIRTYNNTLLFTKALSAVIHPEHSPLDTIGGTFNFLSQSLTLSAENSGKYSENGSVITVEIADRGSVVILDVDDFQKQYSPDTGDNGARSVLISAINNQDEQTVGNKGTTVVAVDNRTGTFNLHSENFKIVSENNALSAYGDTDAGKTASSMTAGLLGLGGSFDLRANYGTITVTSTESARSDEGITRAANNTSESYGLLALTTYDPEIKRKTNGDADTTGGKLTIIGEGTRAGTTINFSSTDEGSNYTISSTASKDSAFGVFTLGSDNAVSFNGNVEIQATSLATLESTNNAADLNAYGIAHISTSTKVIAQVETYTTFESDPEVFYDNNSVIFLAKGAKLNLDVNSSTGEAYGLLQVGENSSQFLGDLSIVLNLNASEDSAFKDSYAILASGDVRDFSHFSSENARTVDVSGNLTINVNTAQKLQNLRKARAIEAKGNSTVNINAMDGSSSVAVLGDLHTTRSIAEDLDIVLPTADYLGVNVNILSWNRVEQEAPLSVSAAAASDGDAAEDSSEQVPIYLDEGHINFVMGSNTQSYLVGAANGNIDMEVGTGACWTVTDDSLFENLRPTGGVIDLHLQAENWNDNNPFQYLMVKNITNASYTANSSNETSGDSIFILNTNILGDLEKDGKTVLSFDGITYYEKQEGDGIITNGEVDPDSSTFTSDGSYVFGGNDVAIELTGFTVAEAAARMRHDVRFGDFLDFRSYSDADTAEQHYRVRIDDKTIADGSIDYTNRVLKFATTPGHVKLEGDWTSLDYTAFKYKPIIWKTEHTDKYVDANGDVLVRPDSVLDENGQIRDAVNDTLFVREDYDKVVAGLVSTEKQPDALDAAEGLTDYWVSGYEKEINDPGKAVTSFVGINFNPIYLSTLRKRLGEVRYGAQDGLWVKGIAMKDSVGGIASRGYDQDLYGFSFGYDHLVQNTEEKLWLIGANIRQAHARQDLIDASGSGETDAIGLNIYATYANYQGGYADFVLSADRYKQEFGVTSDSGRVTGKYNSYGWGASVEVGHMFHTTRNDLSWGPWYGSWWLEPQLQLAYYHVSGEKYTLSSGGRIRQKSADSLIGRAGVVVGKKFNYGEDREEIDRRYWQMYLKAGVKHDFLGDRTVWFNSDRFDGEVAGKTTFYYGLGGDWQFNERMRLYAQLERETGDDYDKDYEISVGLKYEF